MSREDDDNYGRVYEEDEIYSERKSGSLTGALTLISVGIVFLLVTFLPGVRLWNIWPLIIVGTSTGLIITFFVKYLKKRRQQ
jgi:hypothetical protein